MILYLDVLWSRLQQRAQVQTRRGSHTHSVVAPDDRRIVVYNSGTGSVRDAKELAGCVDIQGDACRLVVIDKLPFPVPGEPVFQARADQVKRSGKSDFAALSVPMMTLTLTQGYGRLIRTKKDRGVVAILDSRLSATPWGNRIVEALPESPATTDLAEVAEFYAKA